MKGRIKGTNKHCPALPPTAVLRAAVSDPNFPAGVFVVQRATRCAQGHTERGRARLKLIA